jgi:hypothetical protein
MVLLAGQSIPDVLTFFGYLCYHAAFA